MVVKLDLSIKSEKENIDAQRKDYRYLILFSVVVIVFVSTLFQLSVSCYKIYSVTHRIKTVRSEIHDRTPKVSLVETKIRQIEEKNVDINYKLDYILADVPVVEFMTYLSIFNNNDIKIEEINLNNQKVKISGSSSTEEDSIKLDNFLYELGFTRTSSLPVINQVFENNSKVIKFLIEKEIYNLDNILEKNLNLEEMSFNSNNN
ncbi:MAG: hypothetical protein RR203_07705 [Synergistaceae bacterium]